MRQLIVLARRHLSQQRLAGGAIVLAITQFGASLAGFFRDQAFSIVFPPGVDPLDTASVYIAAFRPSDLLFQIFVMSSLSVVLVPFLASHLARGDRDEMNRMTSSILVLFGTVFTVIAFVAAVFFRDLAPHLTQFTGERLELYIFYGRCALFTNALFVIGNTAGQYLIALQRYWIYGLAPILWSCGTVAGIYLLTPVMGSLGPIIGMMAGTVIYVTYRIIGIWHAGFRFRLPSTGLVHHEIAQMGLLILPRMAALGALQVQLLLFDQMASGLGLSAVSLTAFARNFQSVLVGIAGISLAQSAFSGLSQAAALKHHERFSVYMRKGVFMNLLLTVPGSLALALLAAIPAWLLHLHGPARETFMLVLAVYSISIPFESINHLLLRAFYALKNTTVPAITSVVSTVIAISSGYLLVNGLGIIALPVAYTVGQIMQCVQLAVQLRRATKAHASISLHEATMVEEGTL